MLSKQGILTGTNVNISLEHQMGRLALEADMLTNVIDTFRNLVPNLLGSLKEKFVLLDEDKELSKFMSSITMNYRDLSKKTQHVSFLTVNQTLVSVPESFQGSFLEYANFLNDIAPEIYNDANKTLSEYRAALSIFITNKESTIGLKDHTSLYKQTQKRREELTGKFKQFFPKDNGLSKQRLGSVMERFSDFDKLLHGINSIERLHERQNMTLFRASIQECIELLQIVIKNTESGSCEKISGNSAKNIAEGAFEIAKYVEFVALFRFKVQQFLTAVNNTVTELNASLK